MSYEKVKELPVMGNSFWQKRTYIANYPDAAGNNFKKARTLGSSCLRGDRNRISSV
jgi:hypothetical protein